MNWLIPKMCQVLSQTICAAMSNLKSHAVRCFGQHLVKSALKKTQPGGCDELIFAVFTHQGQLPIKISHCAHTTEESRWVLHLYFDCSHLWNFRAHIARWCAEISHPHRIIKDHQFDIHIKAGHPGTSLPSPMTVSHNIRATFHWMLLWAHWYYLEGKSLDLYYGLFIQPLHRNTLGMYILQLMCGHPQITRPSLLGQCIYTTVERSWCSYLISWRCQR